MDNGETHDYDGDNRMDFVYYLAYNGKSYLQMDND